MGQKFIANKIVVQVTNCVVDHSKHGPANDEAAWKDHQNVTPMDVNQCGENVPENRIKFVEC